MLPTIKVQQIPKFYNIINSTRYISDISFCQDPLKLDFRGFQFYRKFRCELWR